MKGVFWEKVPNHTNVAVTVVIRNIYNFMYYFYLIYWLVSPEINLLILSYVIYMYISDIHVYYNYNDIYVRAICFLLILLFFT